MSNNDFRFLLTMSGDLNKAIETVSSSLREFESGVHKRGRQKIFARGEFCWIG